MGGEGRRVTPRWRGRHYRKMLGCRRSFMPGTRGLGP